MCDDYSDEYIDFSEEDLSNTDFSDDEYFNKEGKIIDITPKSPEENTQLGKFLLSNIRKREEKDYERMSRTSDFKKLEKYASKKKIKGLNTKEDDWIVIQEGEGESEFSIRRNITKYINENLKASRATAAVLGCMISDKLVYNVSYDREIDSVLNNVVNDISKLRGKEYMKSKGLRKASDSDSDSDSD
jgi:hypothetical protein